MVVARQASPSSAFSLKDKRIDSVSVPKPVSKSEMVASSLPS